MKRGSFGKKLAAATLSLALIGGCASRIQPARPTAPQSIAARWELGTCSIEERELNYSYHHERTTLRLDVPPKDARRVLCSLEHTVILSHTEAIVSLGADGVLSGREMLGSLDGRFTPANSYSINIEDASNEGLAGARLAGNTLRLSTCTGRTWTIDLVNPGQGWSIY